MSDRFWRPSTLDAIEHDLAALWREVTKEGPVARAIMSNLVVVRTPRSQWPERRVGVSIDAVAAQHPSRVVIIDHESIATGAPGPTGARVGVALFGPPQARYAVEQIAVHSAGLDESLPSLVRRLVRGGLPISTWWAEDCSEAPLIASILEMGRQLVYDSRRWTNIERGVEVIHAWRHLDLADVNWRRLVAMRRALVVAAAGEPMDWSPDTIRIAHDADYRAQAWLLAGWLASRLDWPPHVAPRIEAAADPNTVLSVTIGNGERTVRVNCDGRRVVVMHPGRPPSTIGIPIEGEADAVSAELHSLSHDVRLHDALSALHRIFSAS